MSTIRLHTPIPGPRSRDLMRRSDAAVVRGAYHATPVFVSRAEGAVIEDVDGNRFIDFAGGIGCLNVGHRAPRVVEAIRRQLDRFLHTSFNVLSYESYVALAERLNAITPGKFAKKTVLVNSGAEAVENAIKIARAYTKRPAILAFEDAFHGRTYMAMAVTSKTHPYKAGFEPFPGEIYRVPYAYCYRCSYSLQYPSCDLFCARHIEDTFKRVVAAESVAAVIVEPVMGEAGFVTPPPRVLSNPLPDLPQAWNSIDRRRSAVRLRADRSDVCLRAAGPRTRSHYHRQVPRRWFATGRRHWPCGNHGHDRPRHPWGNFWRQSRSLRGRARCARPDRIRKPLRSRQSSWRNVSYARTEWQNRWELIGEVRGLGAMQALELVRSRTTREPADEETKQIAQYCYEHGLIIMTAGTYGNVIRLLMPLVITDAQMDEGLDVLEAAFAAVCDKKGAVAQLV